MPINPIIEPYKISRLVFSGGGAKGAVYPGAYAALKETGVFDEITAIAGSSAGAFTAALLATGMSPHDFQHNLVKQNFHELLGELSENAWFSRDGMPLYNFLRDTIKNQILIFLQAQNLTDSHSCWVLLQDLEQTNHSPTFADLELLIESWPKQFKQLIVTAVKENGGELKIFNHHDTPDVEIALACRASGALPVFLTPVEINGEKYSDGGIYDNIPTEFFDKNKFNQYENKFQDQTLVFAFLEGTQTQTAGQWLYELFFGGCGVFSALHGSRRNEHDNITLFKYILGQIEIELQQHIAADLQNTPIEYLIDSAVDKTYENYNWSLINYIWSVIVSIFVAIWEFFRNLFSYKTAVINDENSINPTNDDNYFAIIRKNLKEAFKFVNPQIERIEQSKIIFAQMEMTITPEMHKAGPQKSPALFNRFFIERWAYNLVPKWIGSFKSDYNIADKIEDGFQKIRSDYPLRTVGLGVGDISAIDFDKATIHSRFLSARGYLDTIHSISNHYLYHSDFNPDEFYSAIIKDFTDVYKEILETSKKNPDEDTFLTKITSNTLSAHSLYHFIKETAEADLTSNQAFALTLATELRRKEISREQLFKEIDAWCGETYESEETSYPAVSHEVNDPNRFFTPPNLPIITGGELVLSI